MLNALTIDVEDYYHVAAFDSVVCFADWERYESRVEKNTQRILDLLDAHATNLHRMEERLVRLLQDFSFGTMSEVLHTRGFLNAAGQAS